MMNGEEISRRKKSMNYIFFIFVKSRKCKLIYGDRKQINDFPRSRVGFQRREKDSKKKGGGAFWW